MKRSVLNVIVSASDFNLDVNSNRTAPFLLDRVEFVSSYFHLFASFLCFLVGVDELRLDVIQTAYRVE